MQPGLPETRKTGLLGQFWAKIRTQNPESNHRVFQVLQKPSILHILPQISGKNSQIWLLPFSVTIKFLPVIPLPVTVKHFYRYYRYRPQPYLKYLTMFYKNRTASGKWYWQCLAHNKIQILFFGPQNVDFLKFWRLFWWFFRFWRQISLFP